MESIKAIFNRKKVQASKLVPFGFERCGDGYKYETVLSESKFLLTVLIDKDGTVSSEVIDPSTHEPYTLHLTEGAAGSFVGSVRSEYEKILAGIAENCFEPDVFKTAQARQLIEYVRKAYGDELEYLWRKFPDNAVWRRKDNRKWYGALLTVSRRKLGQKDDEMVEIIDLRYPPEAMEKLIDGKIYFPGWHMNKKSWYTMILDGTVPAEELYQRIDQSYLLADK